MTDTIALPAPTKPARNPLGVVALVLALIALLAPAIGFGVGLITAAQNHDTMFEDPSWDYVSAFFFSLLALVPGAVVALIAIVLGIVALVKRGRSKVAAIIAIVIASPFVIIGLASLPILFTSSPQGVPL